LDVLFLHPNFPGQFRRLARALAADPENRVWGLGDAAFAATSDEMGPVRCLTYPSVERPSEQVHAWAASFEQAVRTGEQVLRTLAEYKKQGLEPDVILTHPGWGDAFFVRDFFPGVKVIGLFEYFYRPRGADVGFDPEFPSAMNDIFRLHARNATQLLALESCDVGVCATNWQRSRFPNAYQPMLEVLHEGIDTQQVCPDDAAVFSVPGGPVLHAGDEVLTYVSRHLEPYRGFHVFMRALPGILRARPELQVLVIGADDATSYGPAPSRGGTWKEVMLAEVGEQIDLARVHFLGALPYQQYVRALQVSAVHIYLTYPFVLSWSLLDAMSAGCLIVASDTAPVKEVINHQQHGLLVDFHRVDDWISAVAGALERRHELVSLRRNARQAAVEKFDFETVTYPRYRELMDLN
jgi:glycosyltransferase involved in cell wall biosynthesis